MKPWGGRFAQSADPTAERFTASLAFDQRLWPQDIAGSMAWARALARARLLTDAERDAIVKGLETVHGELEAGTFPFRPELEDIHMNIERRLQELVGEVGGKLHTGRSRNDQIALDERLYLREVVARTREGLRRVQQALVRFVEQVRRKTEEGNGIDEGRKDSAAMVSECPRFIRGLGLQIHAEHRER